VSGSSEPRREAPRGRLVEGVRLIFIALLGTAGFQVGEQFAHGETSRVLLIVFLGSAIGYVVGGLVGRFTYRQVTELEQGLRKTPAVEIAAGTVGLVVGLIIAALVTVPLLLVDLPLVGVVPGVVFIYISLGAAGFHIARGRKDDLFAIFGLKPRAAGVAPGEVNVIDTSALIDGRIADLVRTGFLPGTFLVHEGVLRELQSIADASDPKRRTRGRRGLDVLATLQESPLAEIILVEEALVGDVDAALVRLARERGGTLITVDANLAKVAGAVSVPVRQINELASAFRVPFVPGEELTVQLVKEGREHGQGIGYLEDGTMVVVERAADRIGSEVAVRVSNVIQTSTGRMVFAALPDAGSGKSSEQT